MLPSWFHRAEGSASVVFILMAAAAWLLLPLAHPVYAALVPPILAGGVAFAVWRVRRGRAEPPTVRPYPRS